MFIDLLFSNWQAGGLIAVVDQPDGRRAWNIVPEREPELKIPDSWQKIILDRVDQMTEEQKKVLRDASVIGHQFPDQVVVRMEMHDPIQGYDHLVKIEEDYHLIRKETDHAIEDMSIYEFQHRSIQDCIYTRMPGGQKKELHLKAAIVMEEVFRNRERVAGRIANHFFHAGRCLTAARYAHKAQKYALKQYLHPGYTALGKYWFRSAQKSCQRNE